MSCDLNIRQSAIILNNVICHHQSHRTYLAVRVYIKLKAMLFVNVYSRSLFTTEIASRNDIENQKNILSNY